MYQQQQQQKEGQASVNRLFEIDWVESLDRLRVPALQVRYLATQDARLSIFGL